MMRGALQTVTNDNTDTAPRSGMSIGYLVPEFPAQTHIFYWREIDALKQEGVKCELISTRRPPNNISSHSWSKVAASQTFYLYPASISDLVWAGVRIAKSGSFAWFRCCQSLLRARVPLKAKLRLVALALLSGKLIRHCEMSRIQHIHVTSCADGANVAMFASLFSNLTYSLTHLGPSLSTYGPNQPEKWRYAKFAILESEMLLDMAKKQIAKYMPTMLAVSSMGVDLDRVNRKREYIPWCGTGTVRIFSCGRLNPVKGYIDLLDAIRMLQDNHFDVELAIAGEDEQGGAGYRQNLEAYIKKCDLQDCVRLLGAVSEEEVIGHLEDSHIFALASLNEGTSIAIMEALAMGVPVVVTRVGNTPQMVVHRQDAMLVHAERPFDLFNALRDILSDSKFASSLSKNARLAAERQFSHRTSARLLASFIRQLDGKMSH